MAEQDPTRATSPAEPKPDMAGVEQEAEGGAGAGRNVDEAMEPPWRTPHLA